MTSERSPQCDPFGVFRVLSMCPLWVFSSGFLLYNGIVLLNDGALLLSNGPLLLLHAWPFRLYDEAVAQMDGAVGDGGKLFIVGDDDEGLSEPGGA